MFVKKQRVYSPRKRKPLVHLFYLTIAYQLKAYTATDMKEDLMANEHVSHTHYFVLPADPEVPGMKKVTKRPARL